MNYKSYLLSNYEKLYIIQNLLENLDTTYFSVTIINEKNLDTNTISIVMTASNRSVQTYYTIETISKSINKNIQIILVDDSDSDPILENKLVQYDVHVELIRIKNKFWINPCINYNIGFKHVRGGKIIIQNAEVCHIGDVINYVSENIIDDKYYVFNVYALENIHVNNLLYKSENNFKLSDLNGKWYQHPIYRNANLHFLTAITKNTFDKINGFDIDYALGVDYDDNELLFKIVNNNIGLIHVNEQMMGIHQWHSQSAAGSSSGKMSNYQFDKCKKQYYDVNKKFLSLTSYDKNEIVEIINKIF